MAMLQGAAQAGTKDQSKEWDVTGVQLGNSNPRLSFGNAQMIFDSQHKSIIAKSERLPVQIY